MTFNRLRFSAAASLLALISGGATGGALAQSSVSDICDGYQVWSHAGSSGRQHKSASGTLQDHSSTNSAGENGTVTAEATSSGLKTCAVVDGGGVVSFTYDANTGDVGLVAAISEYDSAMAVVQDQGGRIAWQEPTIGTALSTPPTFTVLQATVGASATSSSTRAEALYKPARRNTANRVVGAKASQQAGGNTEFILKGVVATNKGAGQALAEITNGIFEFGGASNVTNITTTANRNSTNHGNYGRVLEATSANGAVTLTVKSSDITLNRDDLGTSPVLNDYAIYASSAGTSAASGIELGIDQGLISTDTGSTIRTYSNMTGAVRLDAGANSSSSSGFLNAVTATIGSAAPRTLVETAGDGSHVLHVSRDEEGNKAAPVTITLQNAELRAGGAGSHAILVDKSNPASSSPGKAVITLNKGSRISAAGADSYAIKVMNQAAEVTIGQSGSGSTGDVTVTGDMSFGARADTITINGGDNSGDDGVTTPVGVTVTGDIALGEGSNSLTVSGTLVGTVTGGTGVDTVTVGVGADLAGATMSLGGGADVIIAADGTGDMILGGANLEDGNDRIGDGTKQASAAENQLTIGGAVNLGGDANTVTAKGVSSSGSIISEAGADIINISGEVAGTVNLGTDVVTNTGSTPVSKRLTIGGSFSGTVISAATGTDTVSIVGGSGAISLGGGANNLTVNGDWSGNFGICTETGASPNQTTTCESESGSDTITVESGATISGILALGNTQSTLDIKGTFEADVSGGTGVDTVKVYRDTKFEKGAIRLLAGNDVVIGSGPGDKTLGSIDLGAGDDVIGDHAAAPATGANDLVVAGAIGLGSGLNRVKVKSVSPTGAITGGTGADTIDISGDVAGMISLGGGEGNNTLTITGGFEKVRSPRLNDVDNTPVLDGDGNQIIDYLGSPEISSAAAEGTDTVTISGGSTPAPEQPFDFWGGINLGGGTNTLTLSGNWFGTYGDCATTGTPPNQTTSCSDGGAGADTINVQASARVGGAIHLGEGENVVNIGGAFQSGRVSGGAGADTIKLMATGSVGGSTTGTGNDQRVTRVSLNLGAGAGVNTIVGEGAGDKTLRNISFDLGNYIIGDRGQLPPVGANDLIVTGSVELGSGSYTVDLKSVGHSGAIIGGSGAYDIIVSGNVAGAIGLGSGTSDKTLVVEGAIEAEPSAGGRMTPTISSSATGDDTVTISGGAGHVNLGDGPNTLTVSSGDWRGKYYASETCAVEGDPPVTSCTGIEGGDGVDTFVVASGATFSGEAHLGDGQNALMVRGAVAGNDAKVIAGSGADTVTLARGASGTGTVSHMDLGGGANRILGPELGTKVLNKVVLGDGDDTIGNPQADLDNEANNFDLQGVVELGGGRNTVVIAQISSGGGELKGGSGEDTITISENAAGPIDLGGDIFHDHDDDDQTPLVVSATTSNTLTVGGDLTGNVTSAATGTDTVTINGGSGDITLGGGSNILTVLGKWIGTYTECGSVAECSGDDQIILSDRNSEITKPMSLGDGANWLRISEGAISGKVTMGKGADVVDVGDDGSLGAIDLGDGANSVDIKGALTGAVTAGREADTISIAKAMGHNINLGGDLGGDLLVEHARGLLVGLGGALDETTPGSETVTFAEDSSITVSVDDDSEVIGYLVAFHGAAHRLQTNEMFGAGGGVALVNLDDDAAVLSYLTGLDGATDSGSGTVSFPVSEEMVVDVSSDSGGLGNYSPTSNWLVLGGRLSGNVTSAATGVDEVSVHSGPGDIDLGEGINRLLITDDSWTGAYTGGDGPDILMVRRGGVVDANTARQIDSVDLKGGPNVVTVAGGGELNRKVVLGRGNDIVTIESSSADGKIETSVADEAIVLGHGMNRLEVQASGTFKSKVTGEVIGGSGDDTIDIAGEMSGDVELGGILTDKESFTDYLVNALGGTVSSTNPDMVTLPNVTDPVNVTSESDLADYVPGLVKEYLVSQRGGTVGEDPDDKEQEIVTLPGDPSDVVVKLSRDLSEYTVTSNVLSLTGEGELAGNVMGGDGNDTVIIGKDAQLQGMMSLGGGDNVVRGSGSIGRRQLENVIVTGAGDDMIGGPNPGDNGLVLDYGVDLGNGSNTIRAVSTSSTITVGTGNDVIEIAGRASGRGDDGKFDLGGNVAAGAAGSFEAARDYLVGQGWEYDDGAKRVFMVRGGKDIEVDYSDAENLKTGIGSLDTQILGVSIDVDDTVVIERGGADPVFDLSDSTGVTGLRTRLLGNLGGEAVGGDNNKISVPLVSGLPNGPRIMIDLQGIADDDEGRGKALDALTLLDGVSKSGDSAAFVVGEPDIEVLLGASAAVKDALVLIGGVEDSAKGTVTFAVGDADIKSAVLLVSGTAGDLTEGGLDLVRTSNTLSIGGLLDGNVESGATGVDTVTVGGEVTGNIDLGGGVNNLTISGDWTGSYGKLSAGEPDCTGERANGDDTITFAGSSDQALDQVTAESGQWVLCGGDNTIAATNTDVNTSVTLEITIKTGPDNDSIGAAGSDVFAFANDVDLGDGTNQIYGIRAAAITVGSGDDTIAIRDVISGAVSLGGDIALSGDAAKNQAAIQRLLVDRGGVFDSGLNRVTFVSGAVDTEHSLKAGDLKKARDHIIRQGADFDQESGMITLPLDAAGAISASGMDTVVDSTDAGALRAYITGNWDNAPIAGNRITIPLVANLAGSPTITVDVSDPAKAKTALLLLSNAEEDGADGVRFVVGERDKTANSTDKAEILSVFVDHLDGVQDELLDTVTIARGGRDVKIDLATADMDDHNSTNNTLTAGALGAGVTSAATGMDVVTVTSGDAGNVDLGGGSNRLTVRANWRGYYGKPDATGNAPDCSTATGAGDDTLAFGSAIEVSGAFLALCGGNNTVELETGASVDVEAVVKMGSGNDTIGAPGAAGISFDESVDLGDGTNALYGASASGLITAGTGDDTISLSGTAGGAIDLGGDIDVASVPVIRERLVERGGVYTATPGPAGRVTIVRDGADMELSLGDGLKETRDYILRQGAGFDQETGRIVLPLGADGSISAAGMDTVVDSTSAADLRAYITGNWDDAVVGDNNMITIPLVANLAGSPTITVDVSDAEKAKAALLLLSNAEPDGDDGVRFVVGRKDVSSNSDIAGIRTVLVDHLGGMRDDDLNTVTIAQGMPDLKIDLDDQAHLNMRRRTDNTLSVGSLEASVDSAATGTDTVTISSGNRNSHVNLGNGSNTLTIRGGWDGNYGKFTSANNTDIADCSSATGVSAGDDALVFEGGAEIDAGGAAWALCGGNNRIVVKAGDSATVKAEASVTMGSGDDTIGAPGSFAFEFDSDIALGDGTNALYAASVGGSITAGSGDDIISLSGTAGEAISLGGDIVLDSLQQAQKEEMIRKRLVERGGVYTTTSGPAGRVTIVRDDADMELSLKDGLKVTRDYILRQGAGFEQETGMIVLPLDASGGIAASGMDTVIADPPAPPAPLDPADREDDDKVAEYTTEVNGYSMKVKEHVGKVRAHLEGSWDNVTDDGSVITVPLLPDLEGSPAITVDLSYENPERKAEETVADLEAVVAALDAGAAKAKAALLLLSGVQAEGSDSVRFVAGMADVSRASDEAGIRYILESHFGGTHDAGLDTVTIAQGMPDLKIDLGNEDHLDMHRRTDNTLSMGEIDESVTSAASGTDTVTITAGGNGDIDLGGGRNTLRIDGNWGGSYGKFTSDNNTVTVDCSSEAGGGDDTLIFGGGAPVTASGSILALCGGNNSIQTAAGGGNTSVTIGAMIKAGAGDDSIGSPDSEAFALNGDIDLGDGMNALYGATAGGSITVGSGDDTIWLSGGTSSSAVIDLGGDIVLASSPTEMQVALIQKRLVAQGGVYAESQNHDQSQTLKRVTFVKDGMDVHYSLNSPEGLDRARDYILRQGAGFEQEDNGAGMIHLSLDASGNISAAGMDTVVDSKDAEAVRSYLLDNWDEATADGDMITIPLVSGLAGSPTITVDLSYKDEDDQTARNTGIRKAKDALLLLDGAVEEDDDLRFAAGMKDVSMRSDKDGIEEILVMHLGLEHDAGLDTYVVAQGMRDLVIDLENDRHLDMHRRTDNTLSVGDLEAAVLSGATGADTVTIASTSTSRGEGHIHLGGGANTLTLQGRWRGYYGYKIDATSGDLPRDDSNNVVEEDTGGDGPDWIILDNSGTVGSTAKWDLGEGDNLIRGTGDIEALVTMGAGNDVIGNFAAGAPASDNGITLSQDLNLGGGDNMAKLQGTSASIMAGGGNDTVEVATDMTGSISLGSGANKITAIFGTGALAGGSGYDNFELGGRIGGKVQLGGDLQLVDQDNNPLDGPGKVQAVKSYLIGRGYSMAKDAAGMEIADRVVQVNGMQDMEISVAGGDLRPARDYILRQGADFEQETGNIIIPVGDDAGAIDASARDELLNPADAAALKGYVTRTWGSVAVDASDMARVPLVQGLQGGPTLAIDLSYADEADDAEKQKKINSAKEAFLLLANAEEDDDNIRFLKGMRDRVVDASVAGEVREALEDYLGGVFDDKLTTVTIARDGRDQKIDITAPVGSSYGTDNYLSARGGTEGDVTSSATGMDEIHLAGEVGGAISLGDGVNYLRLSTGSARAVTWNGDYGVCGEDDDGNDLPCVDGMGSDTIVLGAGVTRTGELRLENGSNTVMGEGVLSGKLVFGGGDDTVGANPCGPDGDCATAADNLSPSAAAEANSLSLGELALGGGHNSAWMVTASKITAGDGNDAINLSEAVTGDIELGGGDNRIIGVGVGSVTLGSGHDTLEVTGNIGGSANLGDGANRVTAANAVDITGGTGDDIFTISGDVTGEIVLGGDIDLDALADDEARKAAVKANLVHGRGGVVSGSNADVVTIHKGGADTVIDVASDIKMGRDHLIGLGGANFYQAENALMLDVGTQDLLVDVASGDTSALRDYLVTQHGGVYDAEESKITLKIDGQADHELILLDGSGNVSEDNIRAALTAIGSLVTGPGDIIFAKREGADVLVDLTSPNSVASGLAAKGGTAAGTVVTFQVGEEDKAFDLSAAGVVAAQARTNNTVTVGGELSGSVTSAATGTDTINLTGNVSGHMDLGGGINIVNISGEGVWSGKYGACETEEVNGVEVEICAASGDNKITLEAGITREGDLNLGDGDNELIGPAINLSGRLVLGSGDDVIGINPCGMDDDCEIVGDNPSEGQIMAANSLAFSDVALGNGENEMWASSAASVTGGTGPDRIVLTGSVDGLADLKGGNNKLEAVNAGSIIAGDGDDVVTLTGDVMGATDLMGGNNALAAVNAGSIMTGDGDDMITISEDIGGAVDLMGGNNTLKARHARETISAGGGHDSIELTGDAFEMISLGDGGNKITAVNVAGMSGGSGDDHFTISGNVAGDVNFGGDMLADRNAVIENLVHGRDGVYDSALGRVTIVRGMEDEEIDLAMLEAAAEYLVGLGGSTRSTREDPNNPHDELLLIEGEADLDIDQASVSDLVDYFVMEHGGVHNSANNEINLKTDTRTSCTSLPQDCVLQLFDAGGNISKVNVIAALVELDASVQGLLEDDGATRKTLAKKGERDRVVDLTARDEVKGGLVLRGGVEDTGLGTVTFVKDAADEKIQLNAPGAIARLARTNNSLTVTGELSGTVTSDATGTDTLNLNGSITRASAIDLGGGSNVVNLSEGLAWNGAYGACVTNSVGRETCAASGDNTISFPAGATRSEGLNLGGGANRVSGAGSMTGRLVFGSGDDAIGFDPCGADGLCEATDLEPGAMDDNLSTEEVAAANSMSLGDVALGAGANSIWASRVGSISAGEGNDRVTITGASNDVSERITGTVNLGDGHNVLEISNTSTWNGDYGICSAAAGGGTTCIDGTGKDEIILGSGISRTAGLTLDRGDNYIRGAASVTGAILFGSGDDLIGIDPCGEDGICDSTAQDPTAADDNPSSEEVSAANALALGDVTLGQGANKMWAASAGAITAGEGIDKIVLSGNATGAINLGGGTTGNTVEVSGSVNGVISLATGDTPDMADMVKIGGGGGRIDLGGGLNNLAFTGGTWSGTYVQGSSYDMITVESGAVVGSALPLNTAGGAGRPIQAGGIEYGARLCGQGTIRGQIQMGSLPDLIGVGHFAGNPTVLDDCDSGNDGETELVDEDDPNSARTRHLTEEEKTAANSLSLGAVNLGDGDNYIRARSAGAITAGSGADVIHLTGGVSGAIHLGGGSTNNTLTVDQRVSGNLTSEATGVDEIKLGGIEGNVDLGGGKNDLEITESGITGSYAGGAGADKVEMRGSSFSLDFNPGDSPDGGKNELIIFGSSTPPAAQSAVRLKGAATAGASRVDELVLCNAKTMADCEDQTGARGNYSYHIQIDATEKAWESITIYNASTAQSILEVRGDVRIKNTEFGNMRIAANGRGGDTLTLEEGFGITGETVVELDFDLASGQADMVVVDQRSRLRTGGDLSKNLMLDLRVTSRAIAAQGAKFDIYRIPRISELTIGIRETGAGVTGASRVKYLNESTIVIGDQYWKASRAADPNVAGSDVFSLTATGLRHSRQGLDLGGQHALSIVKSAKAGFGKMAVRSFQRGGVTQGLEAAPGDTPVRSRVTIAERTEQLTSSLPAYREEFWGFDAGFDLFSHDVSESELSHFLSFHYGSADADYSGIRAESKSTSAGIGYGVESRWSESSYAILSGMVTRSTIEISEVGIGQLSSSGSVEAVVGKTSVGLQGLSLSFEAGQETQLTERLILSPSVRVLYGKVSGEESANTGSLKNAVTASADLEIGFEYLNSGHALDPDSPRDNFYGGARLSRDLKGRYETNTVVEAKQHWLHVNSGWFWEFGESSTSFIELSYGKTIAGDGSADSQSIIMGFDSKW